MTILFVSAILPYPLFSGGQVRVYNLLKRLSKEHTILLYSFIRNEEERIYLKELNFCKDIQVVMRGHAWQPRYVSKSLFNSYPLLMNSYNISAMRELIAKGLEDYHVDRIHIEPGYVWPCLPSTNIPIIVNEHNIEHTVYQEYVDRYQYPIVKQLMQADVQKLKKWEKIIWNKSSYVITVSNEDATEVRKIKKNNVEVIPNGIDQDFFIFRPKERITEKFTCLFVGNFRWIQNIDAVKFLLSDIWPIVASKYPGARLHIVGKDFPKKFSSLLSTSVTLIHQVDDIRDQFAKADIVVAPIRVGGGTKYKILEAMAAGIPVITNAKGVQGLPLVHQENCYIGETGDDYVGIIDSMIRSSQITKKVVLNARDLVEKHYSWTSIAKELSTIWKK